MNDKKYIQVGGSTEKALAGDYSLNTNDIIKEAWNTTTKSKRSIIVGLLIVMILGVFSSTLISNLLGGFDAILKNPSNQMILNLAMTVILWPFIAGIEMMGVSHAVGLKTQPQMVFSFLKRSAFIALAALIITSITSLGMYLIIPGIYLSVALSLTIPLIIEKQMTPTAAIILSIKATRFQFFKMLQLYMVLFIVFLISIIPGILGLGILPAAVFFFLVMSWLAPMFYNLKGILYREIFGVKMLVIDKDNDQSSDGFFAA